MTPAQNAATVLERWPGYDEQSWQQRFVELDRRYVEIGRKFEAFVLARAAPALATSEGQEGYAAAFYELAALMGLPAMPDSPATVWKRDMLPTITAALARTGGDGWRGTFNVNNDVWIKLTDAGRVYHRQWHTDRYPTLAYQLPDESLNGWSKWQLWSLMQEFGPAMYMGGRMPFEAGIRFAAPDAGEE